MTAPESDSSAVPYPMGKLLAKLSEAQATATVDKGAKTKADEGASYKTANDHQSSSSSLPITPANDSFKNAAAATRPASAAPNDNFATTEELLRLKLELAQAQNKISRLDQELAQSRLAQPESGRGTPVASLGPEYSTNGGVDSLSPRVAGGPIGGPSTLKPTFEREGSGPWQASEDFRLEGTDTLSASVVGGFQRLRGIWGNGKSSLQNAYNPSNASLGETSQSGTWQSSSGHMDPGSSSYGLLSMDGFRAERPLLDHDMMMRAPTARRGGRYDSRFGSPHSFGSGYGNYGLGQGHIDSFAAGTAGQLSNNLGTNMYPQYQQQTAGSGLSPHATEFTSNIGGAWKTDVSEPPATRARSSETNQNIVSIGHCHRRPDISSHNRAAQLPPPPGPQRHLQLEVHC